MAAPSKSKAAEAEAKPLSQVVVNGEPLKRCVGKRKVGHRTEDSPPQRAAQATAQADVTPPPRSKQPPSSEKKPKVRRKVAKLSGGPGSPKAKQIKEARPKKAAAGTLETRSAAASEVVDLEAPRPKWKHLRVRKGGKRLKDAEPLEPQEEAPTGKRKADEAPSGLACWGFRPIKEKETVQDEVTDVKRIKFDWQAAFARSAKTDEAVEVVEVESGTKKAPKEAEKAADWAETHLPSAQKHLRPKRVWEELRDWLKKWRPQQSPEAALVVGPCGTGKSAGVRLLVKKLRNDFLELDLSDAKGRSFLENLARKQRNGNQLSEEAMSQVLIFNICEPLSPAQKETLAAAAQAAAGPLIFTPAEGLLTSKDAIHKMCREIRVSFTQNFIALQVEEASKRNARPLDSKLCHSLAASLDLRRALNAGQLLSVLSETDVQSCLPQTELAPLAACDRLLREETFLDSLDLIALDDEVPTLLRWNCLPAMAAAFQGRCKAEKLPEEKRAMMWWLDAEGPAEEKVEGEDLEIYAKISELLAVSDAQRRLAEVVREQAGPGMDLGVMSPAEAEALLLVNMTRKVQGLAELKQRPYQSRKCLPDPVCPISTDQVALMATQLDVPKVWVMDRVYDWIIATRSSANRNLKHFRTYLKRQAQIWQQRQGRLGKLLRLPQVEAPPGPVELEEPEEATEQAEEAAEAEDAPDEIAEAAESAVPTSTADAEIVATDTLSAAGDAADADPAAAEVSEQNAEAADADMASEDTSSAASAGEAAAEPPHSGAAAGTSDASNTSPVEAGPRNVDPGTCPA